MLRLAIKALIALLSFTAFTMEQSDVNTFIFFLLVITSSAFNQYYNIQKLTLFSTIFYAFLALFYLPAYLFMPVLIFDVASIFPFKSTVFFPLVFLVFMRSSPQAGATLLLVGVVALVLAYLVNRLTELDSENKEIRDTNASQRMILIRKNQLLLKGQADALHLTKLQERNRIARDIHDTIGHALSRALLQTGALSAINDNPNVQTAIDGLLETLSDSMNSIRDSIHDLKDEAIDLKAAITDLLDATDFKTSFTYDVLAPLPHEVKNCFLIVLKEAITNTRKHSHATAITVSVVEHPAIYQFLIADNGAQVSVSSSHGIGLQNIQERVDELGGYLRITDQNGFKIFITLPKKEQDAQ